MKTKTKLLALLLFVATSSSMFLSCGQHDPYAEDDINWEGSSAGTLELVNGSNKDMILFIGQVAAKSNIIGGVRAGTTRKLDISSQVDDFAVGGYAVLRGFSREEYEKYPEDPSKAKVEFTGMVSYRGSTIFRYNIDPNYIGDNGFRVINRSRVGIELRKDSPDGEKVAYLPALAQNVVVYTPTTNAITLFPVYVFFNKSTGEVSTLKAASIFESIMATPRPLGPDLSGIQNYYWPVSEEDTWDRIVGTLKQPSAYVTVLNGITGQSGYVSIGMSKRLLSQNGYDAIGSGEKLTFEVESTEEGAGINLIIVYYGGSIRVPVLFEGETEYPVIKNGYNYTVTVSYTGGEGGLQEQANYKARIVQGTKRDLSDQLQSL